VNIFPDSNFINVREITIIVSLQKYKLKCSIVISRRQVIKIFFLPPTYLLSTKKSVIKMTRNSPKATNNKAENPF
jgi:hypothetical protein